jgi:hypothetical protein
MLHPAHVLPPGEAMVGAGLSGQLALRPLPAVAASVAQDQSSLEDLAIAPGVAPWVSGRVGIPYDNEGGLTYSGHALRLDLRHAFMFGKGAALSIGLGGTAVLARRPGEDDANGVYGGGGDLPILIGLRSTGDIYAFWFGPRVGFDILQGGIQQDPTSSALEVSGKHFYAGLTAGMRVGFRHIHLALEINAAYNYANGTFQVAPMAGTSGTPTSTPTSTSVQQISLTPAGALEVTF